MSDHLATGLRERRIADRRDLPPPLTHSAPDNTNSSADMLLAPHMKQVLCLLDVKGHCHHLTANWQHVTGHSSYLSLGPQFLERFHPNHHKRIVNKLASVPCEGEQHDISTRCQLRHTDGKWRWIELQVAAARHNTHTEQMEFICTLTDITKHIETEQKLHRAKLQAELAIKGQEEFLANMSHELRTPLNAILGFAQMMEKQVHGRISNPKYRDYLDNIQESGQTLLSKINDLLAISNLSSDEAELADEVIELEELLRCVMENRSHKAFRKQVTIRLSLPKRPIALNGDRILLQQAFSNLLGNAIKYNKDKGKVTITAKRLKGGAISLSFADTGEGISSARLKLLRQSLMRKDIQASAEEERALSMMLVNEFVRLHGGKLRIASEKGKGTTATLELPAERVLNAESTTETSA